MLDASYSNYHTDVQQSYVTQPVSLYPQLPPVNGISYLSHPSSGKKPVPKSRHGHRTRHKKRKEIKDIEFTQGKKEDNIKC